VGKKQTKKEGREPGTFGTRVGVPGSERGVGMGGIEILKRRREPEKGLCDGYIKEDSLSYRERAPVRNKTTMSDLVETSSLTMSCLSGLNSGETRSDGGMEVQTHIVVHQLLKLFPWFSDLVNVFIEFRIKVRGTWVQMKLQRTRQDRLHSLKRRVELMTSLLLR
jgi:hypothetical protein